MHWTRRPPVCLWQIISKLLQLGTKIVYDCSPLDLYSSHIDNYTRPGIAFPSNIPTHTLILVMGLNTDYQVLQLTCTNNKKSIAGHLDCILEFLSLRPQKYHYTTFRIQYTIESHSTTITYMYCIYLPSQMSITILGKGSLLDCSIDPPQLQTTVPSINRNTCIHKRNSKNSMRN